MEFRPPHFIPNSLHTCFPHLARLSRVCSFITGRDVEASAGMLDEAITETGGAVLGVRARLQGFTSVAEHTKLSYKVIPESCIY